MMDLLAQVDPKSFWNAPNGSVELWIKIALVAVLGAAMIFGVTTTPPSARRYVVGGVTFLSGLFYVVAWLYPAPINRGPEDGPRGTLEALSFWVADAQPRVADFANIIGGTLIGLGVYSLLRIHVRRIFKQQRDWGYSAVLLGSLVAMTFFGYADWVARQSPAGGRLSFIPDSSWGLVQYGRDLLFDGLLQQMDAAMFSVVSFYILSAAYRAFRARSVEATILLITALIVMLSFMGLAEHAWNGVVGSKDPNAFGNNFRLTEIAKWLKDNVQTPSIRGIDFGVGVGLMAMALRLWLSLESMGAER